MKKSSKKQIRRASSGTASTVVSSRNADREFSPDYSYVAKDLKRIGILAGSFFVVLIALSFILK
jgi:hypothetical protein